MRDRRPDCDIDVAAGTTPPNPGSREALDAGCCCPVLDNAHGLGYLGGVKDERGETVYVVDGSCDLHGELYEEPFDG